MKSYVPAKALVALTFAFALITTSHAADPARLELKSSGAFWGTSGNWKGGGTAWKDGSIAILNVQNSQLDNGKVFSAYGIEVTETTAANCKIYNKGGLSIGAGGISMTPSATGTGTNGNRLMLWMGGDLSLLESQTWECTSATRTGIFYVGPTSSDVTATILPPKSFSCVQDGVLSLENVDFVLNVKGDFAGASVTADARSVIEISSESDAMLNADTIELNGAQLKLNGNKDVAGDGQHAVAETVALANGGMVIGASGVFDVATVQVSGTGNAISGSYTTAPAFALSGSGALDTAADITVTSLADYSGTAITVSNGTLELPDMANWPAGLIVTTSGGTLKLQTKTGYDPTRVGGTQNVIFVDDEWRVTDEVVTDETLTVGSGSELHIYGNGLTAATTLVLDGGTIIFEDSKTIASPITCNATSIIKTKDDTVVGTLSGYITADCDASLTSDPKTNYLTLSGPGQIVLSGGGLFDHFAGMKLIGGSATVVSNTYAFGRETGTRANNKCGLLYVIDAAEWLTIKDEGAVVLTRAGTQEDSMIDVSAGRTGGIDIQTGGTLTIDQQRNFYIGFNARSNARNSIKINGGTLNLPSSGGSFDVGHSTSYGYLEFNSGTFQANKSLRNGKSGYGQVVWNGGTWAMGADIARLMLATSVKMTIAGPNCVLDISRAAADARCYDTPSTMPWTFDENGMLTVCNTNASAKTFGLNTIFSGSNIAIDNAIVEAKDEDSTFSTIGFYKEATFDASAFATPAEIGTLVIKEGGEWNGGANLVNATFENLTFENGSILDATTDATTVLSGVLTLPEAMQYAVSASTSASRFNVFSAAGGIVKVNPDEPKQTTWTVAAGRSNGGYKPKVIGKMLAMSGCGSMLLLR